MLEADILYIADTYGLSDDVRAALVDAVRARADEAGSTFGGPSVLSVFPEGGHPSVTLGPERDAWGEYAHRAQAPAVAAPQSGGDPRSRYEDLGPIGSGGMGEVRRVRDRDLNRIMAMKVARADLVANPSQIARFVEEAQIAAQLQHPGVVPVHELGRLPDGRFYFTMREVSGRTLSSVIREVHAASRDGHWGTAGSGWTFRRLIEALRRVCETVAYAHARGVIHRDLKPENIMVGPFGEVLVLDWGLAKVTGAAHAAVESSSIDGLPVVTDRSRDGSQRTRMGTVAGTPAYMSPEQALGRIDQVGPPSDVYALGAILYEILAGRPPYTGNTELDVIDQVVAGPPEPPVTAVQHPSKRVWGRLPLTEDGRIAPIPEEALREPLPIPPELQEVCLRAMSRGPQDRFPDAGAMATEVAVWLEGVRKREQALDVVRRAQQLQPEVEALYRRAAQLRQDAALQLAGVATHEPAERKEPGWALEDEAAALHGRARLLELDVLQLLRAALTHVPELPEAHALLAAWYRRKHAAAEARRDREEAATLAVQLQSHDLRGAHASYLRGDGALTLVTDPPGAEVRLLRYEERARRLVPREERVLGVTPLVGVMLPMGSYLLEIRCEGRATVRYPVSIGRQEHWDGVAPGDRAPTPIYLPRADELGPEERYVPAGYALCGGDAERPPARVWVDGFAMRRFPITNAEYLRFLNGLVGEGRGEEALQFAPQERAARPGELGAQLYGRDADGRFGLAVDADGHAWLPDYPVVNVDWHGALACSQWFAAREGRPWRLPAELEREKAGRGVDGRLYPWGDFLDPSFACMRDSHAGARLPAVVSAYPVDASPYGIRGLAGNVRDWCLDVNNPTSPDVVEGRAVIPTAWPTCDGSRNLRGGSWVADRDTLTLDTRNSARPLTRKETIGVRLARALGR